MEILLISQAKPDIIIHAAANANARWCEANPDEAIKLNQESTRSVVEAANNINAQVLLISSYAAYNPINVYGKTKQESEELVKKTKNGYLILRPSLIIGFSPNTTNDRPFNRLLRNIDGGAEAIYDTSWKFQPSYVGHISEVIIQAIQRGIINETISVAVSELKTRFDIARDILEPLGITVKQIDAQDNTPVIEDDLIKLKDLQLPQYSYEEIIQKCIEEIKNRSTYKMC